ncbi:hypothetical protein ACN42_g5939 [Penicillium freii]|uniref:Uncharacterized protein n=1 Tax=Penicillium freii TaxID=48697 RepID=A0A101MII2_PENFR|nr:hypothetical protein ACN42_g5939 [Penicillium freii]
MPSASCRSTNLDKLLYYPCCILNTYHMEIVDWVSGEKWVSTGAYCSNHKPYGYPHYIILDHPSFGAGMPLQLHIFHSYNGSFPAEITSFQIQGLWYMRARMSSLGYRWFHDVKGSANLILNMNSNLLTCQ